MLWRALVFCGMIMFLVTTQLVTAWVAFRASLRSERLSMAVRTVGAAAGWFFLVQFLRHSPEYLSWMLVLFCAWTGAVVATVWYEMRYRDRGIPLSVPLVGGTAAALLVWLLLRLLG